MQEKEVKPKKRKPRAGEKSVGPEVDNIDGITVVDKCPEPESEAERSAILRIREKLRLARVMRTKRLIGVLFILAGFTIGAFFIFRAFGLNPFFATTIMTYLVIGRQTETDLYS